MPRPRSYRSGRRPPEVQVNDEARQVSAKMPLAAHSFVRWPAASRNPGCQGTDETDRDRAAPPLASWGLTANTARRSISGLPLSDRGKAGVLAGPLREPCPRSPGATRLQTEQNEPAEIAGQPPPPAAED